jgi:hypothetical protein
MATILELAEFSDMVYGDPSAVTDWTNLNPGLSQGLAATWKLLEISTTLNGYYGAAYQNTITHEIVIANRGTRPTILTDLLTDLKLAAGGTPDVLNDAKAFALKMAADNPGIPIIETGHSLGGSEAQAATVALAQIGKAVSAVTFNSPGIPSGLVTNPTSYKVLNLYDQGDALHLAGGVHLGSYGQNGLVMMPAGPNTASLAWGIPAAVAAGPIGIVALLDTALYDVLLPAHSIANTVVPYLKVNALGSIGWSAIGLSSPLSLGGTGSSTGPTMSVNSDGALVLTDASGNSVTLTSSADQQNINAIFSGSSSPIFQQLAAMGMVSIPVVELNQVVTGLTNAFTINETITRIQNTDNFAVAFQNTGTPNSIDKFIVTVANPGSAFNYVVPTNGPAVVETINNGSNNISGTVSVITDTANTPLTGGTLLAGTDNTWTDSNGDQYQFVANNFVSKIGTLTITQGLLGTSGADKIVIQNFDLNKAITDKTNGYLGIKFAEQIAVVGGVNPISSFTSGTPADQTADVPTGNIYTFTICGSGASLTDQTIQLALQGSGANKYVCTGANIVAFDANGNAIVTIPAGQDHVTVTLVDTSNSNTADNATLTASLTDANGNTVSSNQLSVTFDQPTTGTNTGSTVTGQTRYMGDGSGGVYPYTYYAGDASNNSIVLTNNYVTGSDSGQNLVVSGDGNDLVVGHGGQNVIVAGNDTLISASSYVYAGTHMVAENDAEGRMAA